MLAICAFYLYDACVPLSADAGQLHPGRSGWHGLLAGQAFEVRWAYLAWPALLQPHRPVYRLRWDPAQVQLPGNAEAVQALQAHAASFSGFAVPLYALGIVLFALLPAALFVWPSDAAQLAVLGLIYGFALWIAVLARRHARRGHTPRRTANSVAMQAVLCPPFALNAVRKLSLACSPSCDALAAAHRLMAPQAWHALAAHAQTVVDAQLEDALADGLDGPLVQRIKASGDRLRDWRNRKHRLGIDAHEA